MLDESRQMGKATHLAILLCRTVKIQVGQRMRLARAWLEAVKLQQMITHEMGGLAKLAVKTQVDAGLAEIDGLELSMTVGEMHQVHIAKFGQVIQRTGCLLRLTQARLEHQACSRGHGHHLQELTTIQAHLFYTY